MMITQFLSILQTNQNCKLHPCFLCNTRFSTGKFIHLLLTKEHTVYCMDNCSMKHNCQTTAQFSLFITNYSCHIITYKNYQGTEKQPQYMKMRQFLQQLWKWPFGCITDNIIYSILYLKYLQTECLLTVSSSCQLVKDIFHCQSSPCGRKPNISCLRSYTLKCATSTRPHVKLLIILSEDKARMMTEGFIQASEGQMNVLTAPDGWCQIVSRFRLQVKPYFVLITFRQQ